MCIRDRLKISCLCWSSSDCDLILYKFEKAYMHLTSIIRKVAMALSGLFLVVFLAQHFTINLTSVFSEKTFNFLSHFMGTNPLVQFILQPILIFGVVFHFVMGFILEIQNRKSRKENYITFKGSANANWTSRTVSYTHLRAHET